MGGQMWGQPGSRVGAAGQFTSTRSRAALCAEGRGPGAGEEAGNTGEEWTQDGSEPALGQTVLGRNNARPRGHPPHSISPVYQAQLPLWAVPCRDPSCPAEGPGAHLGGTPHGDGAMPCQGSALQGKRGIRQSPLI